MIPKWDSFRSESSETTASPIVHSIEVPIIWAAIARKEPTRQKSVNITDNDAPLQEGMIGQGPAMRDVYRMTRKVAGSSATVLLLGETGTGKELVAKAIHQLSRRATGPFIRVNCGALSESLLESELFGHVKGAFTSAHENRTGRFEAAHGGTIFLDEINSISYTMQVKLLRVLQEHEFERVGDIKTISVDCRIVAATNRDLNEMVDRGQFREDLYYRLNVLPIYLPPLRDRVEDIPSLAEHFAKRFAPDMRRPPLSITPTALECLKNYAWPGNVRELENYIERATVLAPTPELTPDLLPAHLRGEAPVRLGRAQRNSIEALCTELVSQGLSRVQEEGQAHEQVMGLIEKELILQVLRSFQGTQTKAASRLGINRNTLHKKIDDYGLHGEAR